MGNGEAQHCDVIIVGAGMVGMTQALAFAKQGLQVTLLEKYDPDASIAPQFDGRVSAVSYGSSRIFTALDVWHAMQPDAQAIWDIRIVDSALDDNASPDDSPSCVHYDHSRVGRDPLGYIVENRHIRTCLLDAVRASSLITLISGVHVVTMEECPGALTLQLSDASCWRTPLVVAADGKFSALREMAGLNIVHKDYPQTAIVCTVTHEYPHNGLAVERFLPAGPFAILPLADDKTGRHFSSLVWTEKSAYADALLALPNDAFNHELHRRFGTHLGAVERSGDAWSYPLALRYAPTIHSTRLVLVGDAAHAIHPIAGQGVNLGFRDAEALAAHVADAMALGADIGSSAMLERYAKERQFDVHAMITVTDSLNGLFSNDNPLIRTGRRVGLAVVERMPPVKHMLMKHAMGVLFGSRAA